MRLHHDLALRWELEHTSVVWILKVGEEGIHAHLDKSPLIQEILHLKQVVAHLLSLLQKLFLSLNEVARKLARLQCLTHAQLLLQLLSLNV